MTYPRPFIFLAAFAFACGAEQDYAADNGDGPGKSSLAGNGGSDETDT